MIMNSSYKRASLPVSAIHCTISIDIDLRANIIIMHRARDRGYRSVDVDVTVYVYAPRSIVDAYVDVIVHACDVDQSPAGGFKKISFTNKLLNLRSQITCTYAHACLQSPVPAVNLLYTAACERSRSKIGDLILTITFADGSLT